MIAAERGHYDLLKWLITNGCPWNEKVIEMAEKQGFHLLS